MIFPKIGDITVRNVLLITSDKTLEEVVSRILASKHAYAIIQNDHRFYLLELFDLICMYRMVDAKTKLRELFLDPMITVDENALSVDIVGWLKKGVETFAVTDETGEFVGILLLQDLLAAIDPKTLMQNYRIGDLFKIKKRNRWIVPTMITKDAVDDMQMKRYDAFLIVENQKPIGLLTSRDILRIVAQGSDLNVPVSAYMSSPVVTIPKDATLDEAIDFLQQYRFNRVVTVDEEGNLVGSLTRRELVAFTYAHWTTIVSRYQEELLDMNEQLLAKSREFERLATVDTLTEVYTRRKFLDLFALEYRLMSERDNRMAFMIVDVDHFKTINDTCGHIKGDEVLKAVARIIKKALRGVDIVARWGGDEFVALLPAADCQRAKRIAQDLIAKKVKTIACNKHQVTVSIGICDVRKGEEFYKTLERADRALYEAKRQGRDRVVCACADS